MNALGSVETSENRQTEINSHNIGEKKYGGNTRSLLRKRFRIGEFLVEKFITVVALISFVMIILIFVFVFREASPIFLSKEQDASMVIEEEQETYGEIDGTLRVTTSGKSSLETSGGEGKGTLKNLIGTTWQPISEQPKYGLLSLIVGSFKVTIVAVLFATPMALLAALFTAMFAPKWAKEVLKPSIEILAGFPSVVIGFFALIVMATVFQNFFGFEYRLNAFLGGIALSLAVIPIIFTVTEDSLSRVPKVLTEASFALGATKWQTAIFVVFPAATPGIFAAILLGIGRAFGETMIVMMATGNAAIFSGNFFEPVRTMSATIGAEMAEVIFGDTHYNILFLIGSILFIFTFTLNAIAEVFIRQRLMKRFQGL